MEKKCKQCGIYKILHNKMNHDFVYEEEFPKIVNGERRYAFDEREYLMDVSR